VNDHAIFRRGLKGILADHEELEIIGEASDGNEAVE
jgi:DNA-binding NarL/FixJ family response regulator